MERNYVMNKFNGKVSDEVETVVMAVVIVVGGGEARRYTGF